MYYDFSEVSLVELSLVLLLALCEISSSMRSFARTTWAQKVIQKLDELLL